MPDTQLLKAAFLFDLDGTLADTLPIILQTSRLALTELGQTVTDQEILALIGVPLLDTGEMLLGPGQGEIYREYYQKHFYTLDASGLQAFAGLPELLAELYRRGGKLACVTSKRQKPAEQTLRQTGLWPYFTALVSAESCAQHKPAAEPALLALELLETAAEQAMFIGDSVFDIGCAQAAGIQSCGVTWGAGLEQQLRQAGASYIAHTVAELADLLLARPPA